MTHINLLPRKAVLLGKWHLDIIILLLAVTVPMVVTGVVNRAVQHEEAILNAEITAAQEEINSFAAMSRADASHSSFARDRQLMEATKREWALLGAVDNTAVCITEMKRSKTTFIFNGESQSMAALSAYLQRLSLTKQVSDIVIEKITQQGNGLGKIYRVRAVEAA